MTIRIAVGLAMALTLPAVAQAQINHFQSGVAGNWSPFDGNSTNGGNYQDYWNRGTTSSSAFGSFGGSNATASAGSSGIRLSVSANSSANFGGSEALAASQWLDIVRVSGLAQPPAQLRMTVNASVSFTLDRPDIPGVQNSVGARVGVVNMDGYGLVPSDLREASSFNTSQGTRQKTEQLVAPPFQNFSFSNLGSSTTFLLNYDAGQDGYLFNIYASALVYTGRGGSAEATASFSVADFQYLDGTSLSNPVSFDSGYVMAPVPEPSLLLLAAAPVLLAIRRRR